MSDLAAIGVVIPGYGHPRFLAEAIHSACNQQCEAPVKVVVVDDGCRFVETADTVEALMARYPGQLYYMRQPNTRLPGARNAGVRFLLELEPDLDVVYFLDADNRIEPYSLEAFRDALGDDPAVGWAFPDISLFGQVWNAEGFDTRETAPRYSRLIHLVGNISEAGSMVRADAFRNDVFYDETMRSGFEDWEFWLSMLDAGYVGVPVRQAGFSYRRRPESMLAGSRRLEDSLIAYMREKHKGLYAPRNLLSLEHQEAPAFSVICVDSDDVFLFSDPLLDFKLLKKNDFIENMLRWYNAGREYFFPDKLLFMTVAQWRQLQESPVFLRWLFWQFRAQKADLTNVMFGAAPRMTAEGRPWGTPSSADQILSVSASGLRGLLDNGGALETIFDLPAPTKIMIETPHALVAETPSEVTDKLYAMVVQLCQATKNNSSKVRHMHRRYEGPNHGEIRANLLEPLCASDEQVPVPVAHSGPRMVVAMDMSIVRSDSALSRVGLLITAAHAAGTQVAIVLEFHDSFDLNWLEQVDWADKVSDIFPLLQRGNHEEFRMYLGRRISARLPMSSKAHVSTFARLADTVVCVGGAGSLEMLGEIRGFGPGTAVWLEPCFEGALEGESFAKMLAYEHAIDFVVCDDSIMASRLSAQGVPPGKIIPSSAFFDSSKVVITQP